MSMHHALVTFAVALQQKLVAASSLAWRMKETHQSKQITNLNYVVRVHFKSLLGK